MTFEAARDWAVIIAAVVAVATFVKALHEYVLENKRKRAQMYFEMRASYKFDEKFSDMFEMLEKDSKELMHLNFNKKQDFLGFYEDLALLMNTGVLKPEVVHYMFGYYAIRCWQSENFWWEIRHIGTFSRFL